MKIILATCSLAETSSSKDERYLGVVTVEDEGKNYIGREYDDDPQSALHRAFAVAAAQVTKRLHDSLRIGIDVKF